MKRIYADFNGIGADGTLRLTCVGSIESILAMKDTLEHGETVLLSDGELEVVARVFRGNDQDWEARSHWDFRAVPQESQKSK
jgi:hypothetical protein